MEAHKGKSPGEARPFYEAKGFRYECVGFAVLLRRANGVRQGQAVEGRRGTG